MPATRKLEDRDVYIYEGQIYIPNTYTAGAVGTRFLTGLRDGKKILGTRCAACNRVYVPARSTCHACFEPIDEWVEVSGTGTLETYTVVYEDNPCQPAEPPLVYGIIRLDGADNGFLHMLGGVDPEDLRVGMRVQAVFERDRTGSILDIRHFTPLGGC